MLWTRPKKGESAGKHIKQHVYIPTGKSKARLIHCPGHSSEEYKVLGYFITKYANSMPTKDRGIIPVTREKINRQKENNAIVNNAADEILLTQKLSAKIMKHQNFWTLITMQNICTKFMR